MGSRSRPTALKILHGERHRSRINDAEPQPLDAEPVPPPDMTDEVRAVWDETIVELRGMGLAHAADSHSLHCYAEAVVNHRKASYLLARSPLLVRSRYDTWMKNPALQVQRDAAQQVRAFAQEFGLTPSARAAINTRGLGGDVSDDNPFASSG